MKLKGTPDLQLMNYDLNISGKILSLNFFNEIYDATRNDLTNELKNNPSYPNLADFELEIKGNDTKSFNLISTAYEDTRKELKESKNVIIGLQKQIEDLEGTITNLNQRIEQDAIANNQKTIPFSSIAKDAKIRYNDLKQIGFAKILTSKDFIKIDTIPVATLSWNKNLNDSIINSKETELRIWLQSELGLDTLFIKREK